METLELHSRMHVDLLLSEMRAQHAVYDVTRRAEIYLAAGLPLEKILDALKISRATWYRRLEELRGREADNLTAANSNQGLRPPNSPRAQLL